MDYYVKLEDIWKVYEVKKKKTTVLRGLNLNIEKGEFVVILGPSGEGKTTILRIISGLLKQEKGHVILRGKVVDDLPPKDRRVAMVPQNYALYPFMSVYDNIAFPLKISHVPKNEIKRRISEITKVLRIDNIIDKKPSQLSGGQMQRVAVARALVKGADIILMDEPLSNLDAQVRIIAREELKQIQRELGPTIIYVTHDQVEALSLATKLAILHEGKVQAFGNPMEIYKNPNNIWVASFLGNPPMNLIDAEISSEGLFIEGSRIPLPDEYMKVIEGKKDVVVGIRPEDIYIDERGPMEGIIDMVEKLGSYSILHVKVGDNNLRVIVTSLVDKERGDKVRLGLNYKHISIFDKSTQQNLLAIGLK
ncbi:MAG: ABC transporter ATP-binding protein [Caldisphaeraceae archaeon]|nr:ABC transporter ATP-binding protein [Caldisphaeraceae archaeon]